LRYLACEDGDRPSWREMARTLEGLDGVTLESGSVDRGLPCYHYRNHDTGVEAWFRGYLSEHPDEVGLSFEMARPRPAYFAHEALPLAVQVARELRLDIWPRGGEGCGEVNRPTKEGLLEVWTQQNAEARRVLEQERGPAPACRAEDLESSWEYLTLREELSWRYGRRGVAVPGIEFVRRRRTGEVLRLCRWTGLGPSIFPAVDLVCLEAPPDPLKTGKILCAAELSEAAHRWIRDVPQPIFHRTYLETSPPEGLLEILSGLKGTTMRSYEPIDAADLNDT
jgi:hypothetical protein